MFVKQPSFNPQGKNSDASSGADPAAGSFPGSFDFGGPSFSDAAASFAAAISSMPMAQGPAAPSAFQPAPAPSPFSGFGFGGPGAAGVASAPAATTTAIVTNAVSHVASTSTVTSAPPPAWVGTLQTASIAADMAAADVNGTVSYAGLKTLLTDLDSKLSTSRTALTTAELSDLKTIAANLNNGMTTSAYLTGIMNSLVNGSADNATYTGGAATSTTLGNLAVGSSATQLSELIGKWVLGNDLPSSSVSMTGYAKFTVSYSATSAPLFAASGPSMNDVNQGYLGDCYLESSLAEVAFKNPNDITSMFTSNGNNSYGVKFYVDGVAQYVTVNNQLADGGTIFNAGADAWASLAEKAYVQIAATSAASGNSWSTIGNGGAPEVALEAITGASQINDFTANGKSFYDVTYNASFTSETYTTGNSVASVTSVLVTDLAKGDDLVLCSYTNASVGGKTTLVADHAMSVIGFDATTGNFVIRNPWGTEAGQTWDTQFEVSLSTLLADGDTITADNVGAKALNPILAAQTAAQTWKLGQAVNFALPAGTFTDPRAEAMSYTATLSNGAALPSWLSFNSTTHTFTGKVPNTAAGLSIKVTATDTGGLSTSEIFTVSTPASAPTLAVHTANQSFRAGQAVNLALPAGTFVDPQAETLTYAATQSNGTALPAWLSFNRTTDTFTGTAPSAATASSLTLKVTATDTSGLSVAETFSVTIAAAAAKLAQAVSSIVSTAGTATMNLTHGTSNPTTVLASPVH